MSALKIDGSKLSKKIKETLKAEVAELLGKGITISLAVIIVGDDPASRIYVNWKKNDCKEVGIKSHEYSLNADTSEEELVSLIRQLNNDPSINGILVQLPLPGHINEERIISAISPEKDVDCFHPYNVGRLMMGNPVFLPCTPGGVMELLDDIGVDPSGKECVVVGRSNIVGKPQAMLLLSRHGTVTVCHSKTKNLEEICKRADILVVAIGKPEYIKGNSIKKGAIVIDVGINRLENRKIVGDVHYESAAEVAFAITPVPGGVGPMTRAMLLKNTVKAARIQHGLSL